MATFTTLQALTTKTAVFNGTGVDISGVTDEDYTISIDVKKMTATGGVTPFVAFTVEDSVNAFTGQVVRAAYNVKGALNQDGKQHGQKTTWRKRDLVGLRAGTVAAVLRVSIVDISANTTVEYEATMQRVS